MQAATARTFDAALMRQERPCPVSDLLRDEQ